MANGDVTAEWESVAQSAELALQRLTQAQMALAFLGEEERATRVSTQLQSVAELVSSMQSGHTALVVEYAELQDLIDADTAREPCHGPVAEPIGGEERACPGWSKRLGVFWLRFRWLTPIGVAICVIIAAATGLLGHAPSVGGPSRVVPCLAFDEVLPGHKVIPYQGISADPGSSITVVWSLEKPGPGALSPSTPVAPIRQATMQALLFGPFDSLSAVDQLNRQSVSASTIRPVLASSTPIVSTGCTPQFFISDLTLPDSLIPGYYDLYLTASASFAGGVSGTTREIPIRVGPTPSLQH
jgi:hypothetical protein